MLKFTKILSLAFFVTTAATAGAKNPLDELLAFQKTRLTEELDLWIDFAPAFVSDHENAMGTFFEQPSVFFSPLLSAAILGQSNAILEAAKGRALSPDESFAVWLATTQLYFNLKCAAVQISNAHRNIPGAVDESKAKKFNEGSTALVVNIAKVLAKAVPVLNPEFTESKRVFGKFSELSEMLLGPNPRWGADVFFTFSDQGGSMTWSEPHFHDAKRIAALIRNRNPAIQFIALAKLAQLSKYSGARAIEWVKNAEVEANLLAILRNTKLAYGARGLAGYILLSAYEAPKERVEEVYKELSVLSLEIPLPHDVQSHLVAELLAELPRKRATETEGRTVFSGPAVQEILRKRRSASCEGKAIPGAKKLHE